EVLDGTGGDDVSGQEQAPGQYGTETVEEHVQTAECRTEESGGGHPDSGVASDHGDVGHQCEFESTSECVSADLTDGDLREAEELVVEVEGLAVDDQSAALAGPALPLRRCAVRFVAVPTVGVVHVRPGTEDPRCAA